MAAIAALELHTITAFTVGVDTYPDIRSLRLQRTPLGTYQYRPEGSMRPTKITQVASDGPPVTGSIGGKTLSMEVLSDTSAATATVSGINAATGAAVTVTLTNPSFKEFSGGFGATAPDASSLGFEATDFSIA